MPSLFESYGLVEPEELPKAAAEPEGRGALGGAKDVGISLLKGAIAVPESVVGLADLVTGGRAGQVLEEAGFRPREAKAMLDEAYTPAQKQAFGKVQAAQGFMDVLGAAVSNPSVVAHSVLESLPLVGAGGVAARGGMALAPRLSPVAAAAAGEGALGAGMAAEGIRQQTADGTLTGTQSALAAGTGAATGLLGALGAKIAKSLGIADIDTMVAGTAADPAVAKGLTRRVLEGAAAEGLLEELPQSVQEQVLQNHALGKPLDEGVDQAAVLGMLSGTAMGGAVNVLAPTAPPVSGPLSRAANSATAMPQPAAASAGIEAPAAGAAAAAAPAGQPAEPVVDPVLERIKTLQGQDRQEALAAYNIINREDAPKGVRQYNSRLLDQLLAKLDEPGPVEGTPPADLLASQAGQDPLQGAMAQQRDEDTTRANLSSWMARAKPLALDKARELQAAASERGLAMEIVPHEAGQGFTIVPAEWMAPQLRNQTGTMLPMDTAPTGVLRADAAGNVAAETGAQRIDSDQEKARRDAESQRKAELGLTPDIEALQAGQTHEPLAPPEAGDTLNKQGKPFTTKGAALRAQKASASSALVRVQGGWALRPQREEVADVGGTNDAGAVAAADAGPVGADAAGSGGNPAGEGVSAGGDVGGAAAAPAAGSAQGEPVRAAAGEQPAAVEPPRPERARDSASARGAMLEYFKAAVREGRTSPPNGMDGANTFQVGGPLGKGPSTEVNGPKGIVLRHAAIWKEAQRAVAAEKPAGASAEASSAPPAAAVPKPLDHGELNIPGRTNSIDAELDRFKADQEKAKKAETKRRAAGRRESKEAAKQAFAELWPAMKEKMGSRFGEKELRSTLDSMVKWEPDRFLALAEKFRSEQVGAPFKRSATATAAQRAAGLQQFYDAITGKWANAPEVVVVESMDDERVPASVREDDQVQKSQGAEGDPQGFVHEGKVYVVADSIMNPLDAVTVLAHESLGHYGLQGTFGEELGPIKQQVVAMRRKEVLAKVQAYGLDPSKREHLLYAAEEVLAEMAQATPQLGFVRRVVAAVRNWLRDMGLQLELTDEDIIQRFILPAREWVVRGGPGAKPGAAVQFSRGDAARQKARWSSVAETEYGPEYSGTAVQLLPLGERDTSSDLADNGLPLGHAAHVVPGHKVYEFAIARDGALVGRATLEVDEGGNIEAVHDIDVDARRGGTGRAVMEAILASAPGPVRVIDIVPGAVAFWDKMGVGARDVYENATTSWGDYQGARARSRGKEQGKGAAAQDRPQDAGAARGTPEGEADPDVTPFSRGAAGNVLPTTKTVSASIIEAMNDSFNAPGKISWWHKTVGTQYNLAQRSPEFKRVFDSVQDFLHDVSLYATEAADLAPRILPKLETWRDIGKSPISPEDNKAVAAPIFEGTLVWARDESGKPIKVEQLRAQAADLSAEEKAQRMLRAGAISENVLKMWKGLPLEQYEASVHTRFDNQMLRGGIVWSDAELREQFKLTDAQVALYREFRAAVDRSVTHLAISDMVRFGGADVAAVRQDALDAGDVDAAALILRDHLLELAGKTPDRNQVLVDTADRMIEKADRARELMDRGYAPLSRFGHYTVDVIDESGERVYFGMFESAREAALMARKMRGNFPQAQISRGTVSQEEYKLFAGVSPETVELFGELLGLEAQGDDAASKAFQTYMKVAKANRSAMKRLIERKGIAGFSEDVGRVLAGFVYSNSRQTSQNLHMGEMTSAAAEVSKGEGELKDQATRLVEYVKNPVEEAQAFRGLLFAQYLGGSVASALVNMMQPVQVTFPWLAQHGGVAKAAAQMTKAIADAKRKTTGDRALDAALKQAEEEGIVAPQEVHQLQAQAAGRGVLKSGDGTVAGNAAARASNALSRLALAWGKLFGVAEQFNRRVTFIAAYRTAVDQGMADPADFAEKAIAETQFIYNKGNKPEWARGAIGSTLFTFKQYSISYVELLHRMATQGGPAGKRATLLALGMLFLFGGAGGLPFAEDVEDLVDAVMQRLGYNFSSKLAKKQFFEGLLGKELGRFAERGLSGLPGVPIDVAGRLGMGNLLPGTGLLVDKQDHTRDVTEIAGAGGDFVSRLFSGTSKALQGELFEAAKEVAPRAAANAAKAAEMYSTGVYKDVKGRKVIDVDGYDALAKAAGFQPTIVSTEQERTRLTQQLIGNNKLAESQLAERWAKAVAEGDQKALADVREDLRAYNEKNPDTPIRINRSQIAKRVAQMRMTKEQRVMKAAPKEIRATVVRELAPT
jgi:hypothetical protein